MKLRLTIVSIALSGFALTAGAMPVASAAPIKHATLGRGAPLASWPGLTSSNWSGYATPLSAKVTYAGGTWKVPKVTPQTGYSSSWVGVDGYSNNNLIQTGTEQDYVNGHFVYRAWWEILPAAETVIPSLPVSPGDTFSASVTNTAGNNWVITITNETKGKTFSINKSYNGPGTSAEWIQEAPSNGSGVLPLAHYKKTQFDKLTVGRNFASPSNASISFPSNAIAMVQKGKQVSTPSRPTQNSFNIAYGKNQPGPPAKAH